MKRAKTIRQAYRDAAVIWTFLLIWLILFLIFAYLGGVLNGPGSSVRNPVEPACATEHAAGTACRQLQ